MKKSLVFLLALTLQFCMSATASATFIRNDFGLADPATTITFDELILPDDTLLSTQYAPYGVTFGTGHVGAPGVLYNADSSTSFPLGISGNGITNFDNLGVVISPVIYINFAVDQTEAAISLATLSPTVQSTFWAYNDGVFVEGSTKWSNTTESNNYYAFSGIVFDQIIITPKMVDGAGGLAYIDNIQLSAIPVPEPATVLLLGSGLIGLIGFRKKFKKS